MYEDRDSETIREEMLADADDQGMDRSEGSLIYNAITRMAYALEQIYSDMSELYDNMLVDTQDLDHLMESGVECGCPIEAATAAIVKATFNIAVDIGTEFETPDSELTYTVISLVDDETHTYQLTCDDEGTEANTYLGEIEPVDYIEDFESGEITEIIAAGEDQEDTEVYRMRRINYYNSTRPFAGNRAYYEQVDTMDGVGGHRVQRVTSPGAAVVITIIGSDYHAPSTETVTAVQEAVDPTDESGEGKGIAPIGCKVTIQGVTETTVNIAGDLTYADDVTADDVSEAVAAAIDTCITELNQSWDGGSDNLILRLSKIEVALLSVENVIDVESLTINGTAANFELPDGTIAKVGELTWS